jgi:hypothetical protein
MMSFSEKSRSAHLENQQLDESIPNKRNMQKQEHLEHFENPNLRRSEDQKRLQRERFSKFQLKPSNRIQSKLDVEELCQKLELVEKQKHEVVAFLEQRAKARREFQLEKARKTLQQLSDSDSTASIASTTRYNGVHCPQG